MQQQSQQVNKLDLKASIAAMQAAIQEAINTPLPAAQPASGDPIQAALGKHMNLDDLTGTAAQMRAALKLVKDGDALDDTGRMSTAQVIGLALSHKDSGIERIQALALAIGWDRQESLVGGGSAQDWFTRGDPDHPRPVQVATIFKIAQARGYEGEVPTPAWTVPQPLPNNLLPVPPFIDALLPAVMRDFVKDVATRMQCPIEFVVAAVLTAASIVIGRKVVLQPKGRDGSWQVVPNLWGAIVGRPGVMKSPAVKAAFKPLKMLAAKAAKAAAQANETFSIETKIADVMAKQIKADAESATREGKFDEARAKYGELAALEKENEEKRPDAREYSVNDTTVEALQDVMARNPWGMLVYRDELTGLLQSLDKENQKDARGFYLSGHDGDESYDIRRVSRGHVTVDAITLSLFGSIQPGKLEAFIRQAIEGGNGDDGLMQRFQMLLWPDISEDWVFIDQEPNRAYQQAVFRVFEGLDDIKPVDEIGFDMAPTGKQVPRVMRFSDSAQVIFNDWLTKFEKSLGVTESGDHPAIESHRSKYRKLMPALSLILQLIENPTAHEVGPEAVYMAAAWCDYLEAHARRAYMSGVGLPVGGAKELIKRIESGEIGSPFKPGDVYTKGWPGLSSKDLFYSAAGLLVDLGWLRRVDEPSGVKGGRPSVKYEAHPDLIAKVKPKGAGK